MLGLGWGLSCAELPGGCHAVAGKRDGRNLEERHSLVSWMKRQRGWGTVALSPAGARASVVFSLFLCRAFLHLLLLLIGISISILKII